MNWWEESPLDVSQGNPGPFDDFGPCPVEPVHQYAQWRSDHDDKLNICDPEWWYSYPFCFPRGHLHLNNITISKMDDSQFAISAEVEKPGAADSVPKHQFLLFLKENKITVS